MEMFVARKCQSDDGSGIFQSADFRRAAPGMEKDDAGYNT